GPDSRKMLDPFAEQNPIDHRNLQHKPYALRNITHEMWLTSEVDAKAGLAKKAIPALWERNRHWLKNPQGGDHPHILAAARFRDRNDGQLALVFSNFHGEQSQFSHFRLTPEAGARIKDNARYQAYDFMGDRGRGLWGEPITGRDLKSQGIYVELQPNQTQVLDMREMRHDGKGWQPVGRHEYDWLTVGHALEFQ
ncbi:MAG: hypothetical protein JRH20_19270, partial [Deltaproteobacteria bacterium]|nr:hypothetical protein [Deltaproteobacteria bacterium]